MIFWYQLQKESEVLKKKRRRNKIPIATKIMKDNYPVQTQKYKVPLLLEKTF